MKIAKYLIALAAWGFLLSVNVVSAETIEKDIRPTLNLQEISDQLVKVWPDKACAYYIGYETGYPLVSIACNGNYTASERRSFLDVLYRSDYFLKNETYKLRFSSGTYLYKTVPFNDEQNPVFFKLYVRNAVALYPQMPLDQPQIALVVNDLMNEKQLSDWQSLGIPMTYSIAPFRDETAMLRERVLQYSQEAWVTLRFEPVKTSQSDGKVLTLAETLDTQELSRYIDELKASLNGPVRGFTYKLGSAFVKNVFALRSVMAQLLKLDIESFLAPTNEIAPRETARIMTFRSFQASSHLQGKPAALTKAWASAIRHARKNGYAIVLVDASDHGAFVFLRAKVRPSKTKKTESYKFLRMSELPAEDD